MTDLLVKTFLTFLTLALTAASVQNIALVKGFGISSLIRIPREFSDILQTGILIFFAVEISSLFDFLVNYYLLGAPLPEQWRGMALAVYSIASYFVILALSKIMLLPREAKKTAETLPSVCFSYAVLGTLSIVDISGYTLIQCLGYGAGAAVGYVAALLLTVEGYKIANSEHVPRVFRGMPATLLYLSGLILSVYALSKSV